MRGNVAVPKWEQLFSIKNAKLEIPSGQNVCIFALGSILQPITAALIQAKEGKGILNLLKEWQCPDPLAKVIFRIEELSTEAQTKVTVFSSHKNTQENRLKIQ